MATDNSNILQNEIVGRSYFDIARKTHTSQKLGQVSVSDVQFGLPKDTIKHSKGQTYELKPTTNRIVSKIYGNSKSCAVPLRQVWKYFNDFLAKNKHFIECGAFNTTYMMRKESETAKYLPYCNPVRLIGCFLACFGDGYPDHNGNQYLWACNGDQPLHQNDATLNGNAQTPIYSFLTDSGTLKQDVDGLACAPWWLPRLVGDGFFSSGVNVCEKITDGTQHITFAFTAPEVVYQARFLYELMKANNPSTNFVLQTNEINTFFVGAEYDSANNVVNFGCGFGSQSFGDYTFGSTIDRQIMFSVRTATSGTDYYGDILIGTTTTDTYGESPVSSNIVPCLVVNGNGICQYALSLICTAFFNTPEMLGRGSLLENFGVHLFDYKTIYEIWSDYVGTNIPVGIGVSPDALFPVLDRAFTSSIISRPQAGSDDYYSTQLINIFPFLAYQRFCTERLLLPHNVLSNNQGEDSTLDSAPYDSPFYRNNMIPTTFWGKPESNGCILRNSAVYVGSGDDEGCWLDTYDGGVLLSPEYWEYKMPVNQILTIFLSRGVLLDMDVFNRVWQKQNENVDTLLAASSFNAVNDNKTINAKLFLLAKKFARYVRFGNTDQTVDAVYQLHFGVNDIPEDACHSILLSSDRVEVDCTDVLNQGGAVDESGNTRPLGDRVSIVTKSVPLHHDYECYCPEFCYLFDLHWFSTELIRTHVPEPNLNWISSLVKKVGDMRRNFQLFFFPEYQDSGDEMILLSDVIANEADSNLAWSNKNQLLKDGFNELKGEFRSKFYKMVITPFPEYRRGWCMPSLTYGYFQPTPFQYDLHLVDRYGDAFLVSHYRSTIRKSTMTKTNSVGLNM